MVLADVSFMGGGHTLLVFVPFLYIVGGLAFISMAARDRRARPGGSVRRLPTGREQHLHRFYLGFGPPQKHAGQAPQQKGQKPGQKRRSGPRWLTPL